LTQVTPVLWIDVQLLEDLRRTFSYCTTLIIP
jgi:hypothetical protein